MGGGGGKSSSCAELWADGPRLCVCEWLTCITCGPACESESVGVLLGLLLLTRLNDEPIDVAVCSSVLFCFFFFNRVCEVHQINEAKRKKIKQKLK